VQFCGAEGAETLWSIDARCNEVSVQLTIVSSASVSRVMSLYENSTQLAATA
jgi:hypothetical protein